MVRPEGAEVRGEALGAEGSPSAAPARAVSAIAPADLLESAGLLEGAGFSAEAPEEVAPEEEIALSRFPWRLGLLIFGLGMLSISLILARETRYVQGQQWQLLERDARAVEAALRTYDLRDSAQGQALARALGQALHLQVSVFDAQAAIVFDSEERVSATPAQAPPVRAELSAALAQGEAQLQRRSHRTQQETLYVAVRQPDGGVLRVAKPLSSATAVVEHMRATLLVAAGLWLLLTGLVGTLIFRWTTQPLRRILESTQRVALRYGRGSSAQPEGALAGLPHSIDSLGRRLQQVVSLLTAERDRIEAVLEGMDEGVIALDAQGQIALMNRAGLALFELSEAPIGRPLLELVRAPALHDALAPALEGQAQSVEFSLPGLSPRHLMAHVSPQRNRAGAVVVMLDVTRLRQLESLRRDFVANVSHELRTPVSVIRANAENLLDGGFEDPVHGPKFAQALLRNAERLSLLIADLLDIARIESGKFPIKMGLCRVIEPVMDAFESVSILAQAQRTQVQIVVPEALKVRADRKALTQVLTNLMENAVKYIPSGGQVTVEAKSVGKAWVQLEVRDNGQGISAAHKVRIFERFYRVDAGRSKQMGGTGLGLSIVKHLVQAMAGEVSVHDHTPQGTCFRIKLPSAEA